MKAKKSFLKRFSLILLSLTITFIILCLFFVDNKTVEYDNYYLNNSSESSIKVIHLSDLHFPKIKVDVNKLIKNIKSQNPDIIAITGDLVDQSANIAKSGVYDFIDKINDISPTYYVNGNHEENNKQKELLYNYIISSGIIFLDNKYETIRIKDKEVTLIGLFENDFDIEYENLTLSEDIKDTYKILLSHRPEKFNSYCSSSNLINPNLVLTGHAHGGQVRIFNQGLFAPSQGIFPKYTSGLYTNKDETTSMVVSRGIGNSFVTFRFNNKPHVPIITIYL